MPVKKNAVVLDKETLTGDQLAKSVEDFCRPPRQVIIPGKREPRKYTGECRDVLGQAGAVFARSGAEH